MNTATISTEYFTNELQYELVDLARYAHKAATTLATATPNTPLPLREWLMTLANDLQHHASALSPLDDALDGTTTYALPGGEPTQHEAMKAIERALEQIGNEAREQLVSLPPDSAESDRLDDLVQSLDMHWWVCHRAAA
ncbi:MAG: hypothetical protein QOH84_1402 [Kribbellaceae bacterium]|nr:hypothetical protein [Kribbellaceae bacterium]